MLGVGDRNVGKASRIRRDGAGGLVVAVQLVLV